MDSTTALYSTRCILTSCGPTPSSENGITMSAELALVGWSIWWRAGWGELTSLMLRLNTLDDLKPVPMLCEYPCWARREEALEVGDTSSGSDGEE